jgi:RNA polymerase sigma factor for flagellar operon FliA
MSASQPESADPEKTFLDNLPVIERIVAVIARRHSLTKQDADDFGSWAKSRIIENDYAVLRKFAGRSTLSTYLTVVLTNSFRDYRNGLWGRWRPSAEATRLGPTGIRLEELLYRDDCSLREAIAILQSAGCDANESELRRMASRIPPRSTHTEISIEKADDSSLAEAPQTTLSEETLAVTAALREAVEQLPPDDRVIARMRFWDDLSVADIARALRIEQKPLYRKLESIQSRLRLWLEARGINRERAAEVLAGESTW